MVLKPLGVSVSVSARNFSKAEYMLQFRSYQYRRGKGTGAEVQEKREKISSFNNLILACLNMLRYHFDNSPEKEKKKSLL